MACSWLLVPPIKRSLRTVPSSSTFIKRGVFQSQKWFEFLQYVFVSENVLRMMHGFVERPERLQPSRLWKKAEFVSKTNVGRFRYITSVTLCVDTLS
jgi:hypothetical protein